MKQMQILVVADERLTWKTVDTTSVGGLNSLYNCGRYCTTEGYTCTQFDVFDVRNDIRKLYSKCNKCGQLILKRNESSHGAKMRAKMPKDCTKCQYIGVTQNEIISRDIKLRDDGTYVQTQTRKVDVYCNVSGWRRSMASSKAEHTCIYTRCEDALFKNCADLDWVKNPHIFRVRPSINAIKANERWHYECKKGDRLIYRLGSCNVRAHFDTYGILMYFTYESRECPQFRFLYSKKLDKFYTLNNSNCISASLMYQFPESRRERWQNIIKELYQEDI